jgi:hypothetical protein
MDANHNNTISLDEFVSGMQEYAARSFPGTSDDYSVRGEERKDGLSHFGLLPLLPRLLMWGARPREPVHVADLRPATPRPAAAVRRLQPAVSQAPRGRRPHRVRQQKRMGA